MRVGAKTATPRVGEIPAMLLARLQSIRAYDRDAMMVAAEVVDGDEIERAVERLFEREDVEYLHLHNVAPGCFNCRVERVRGTEPR